MNMYIPLLIVVLSNVFYHICSKSTPQNINTFASLAVTYAVSAVACLIIFLFTKQEATLLGEWHKLNWTSIVLGISVIGLEAGFMLMYRVGWTISTAQVVQGAILAIVLVVVGYLFYKEAITLQKIAGIIICLGGLYLLNK